MDSCFCFEFHINNETFLPVKLSLFEDSKCPLSPVTVEIYEISDSLAVFASS